MAIYKVYGCSMTINRLTWAMKMKVIRETSTDLQVRFRLKWRGAGHCKRAVYRFLYRKGEDWQP